MKYNKLTSRGSELYFTNEMSLQKYPDQPARCHGAGGCGGTGAPGGTGGYGGYGGC